MLFSFTRSIKKKSRAKQKSYLISPNFFATNYRLNTTAEVPALMGHLFESLAYRVLEDKFKKIFFFIITLERLIFWFLMMLL